MEISALKAAGARSETVTAAAPKSGSQSFSQSFQQQMNEQERREYRDRIGKLFDEIREKAPALLKMRDLTAFETYREKIAVLMDEILHHAYLFQPERVRDNYGHQKVYSTVTVVDQKLEKLGEELLSENSEQLDFISRIDEIRGLILDLFS
jgi:uncharacterized protein YaaR (DUF327 family)